MTRRTFASTAWTLAALAGSLGLLTSCTQLGLHESETTLSSRDPKPANDQIEDAPTPKINARTFFAAGQVHEREGNYLAASQQYYRAVATDPNYVMAFNRLGICFENLKLFDRANAAFEKAIALAPKAAFLRNNLGYSRMLQGDYGAAECALRESLAIQPDYKRAQANLAVVLTRTNRVNEAVELFAQAVSRDNAFYNVGVLCVADGRYAEARAAFTSALQVNPGMTAAKTQLEKLNGLAANPEDPSSARYLAAARRVAGAFGPTPTTGGAGYVPDLEWSQPDALAAGAAAAQQRPIESVAAQTPPQQAPQQAQQPSQPVMPSQTMEIVDLTRQIGDPAWRSARPATVAQQPISQTSVAQQPIPQPPITQQPIAQQPAEQPQVAAVSTPQSVAAEQPGTITTVSQFVPPAQRGTELARPAFHSPAPAVAQAAAADAASDGAAAMQPLDAPAMSSPRPAVMPTPVAEATQSSVSHEITVAASPVQSASEWRVERSAGATHAANSAGNSESPRNASASTAHPTEWQWLTGADSTGSPAVAASATVETTTQVDEHFNDEDAQEAWVDLNSEPEAPAVADAAATDAPAVTDAVDSDDEGEEASESAESGSESIAQAAPAESVQPNRSIETPPVRPAVASDSSAMTPVTHWETLTAPTPAHDQANGRTHDASIGAAAPQETPRSEPTAQFCDPRPLAPTEPAAVRKVAYSAPPTPAQSPVQLPTPSPTTVRAAGPAETLTLLTPPVDGRGAATITASATCDTVTVAAAGDAAPAAPGTSQAASPNAAQLKRLAPLAPLMLSLIAPPAAARPATPIAPARREEPAQMTAVGSAQPARTERTAAVSKPAAAPSPATPAPTSLAGAAQPVEDDDVVDLTPRQ